MIEQLLDYSLIHRGGGLPVTLQHVDLGRVCRAVVEEMETGHPGTRIEWVGADEIWGHWDEDRLGEVLSNLIGNAIRYGDGGPITVALRQREKDVLMTVHNAGEPIPDEAMPRLFDPFCRGHAERRSKDKGLGLGLYIVRQIVQSHSGDITVKSSRDEGTTFTVVLPRQR